MTIIVDSDGLIEISNETDAHYSKSISLLKKLNENKAKFIYPATVIAETTAILQIRLNKQDTANEILELVKSGKLYIEPVDQAILVDAASILRKDRSKHATLFDAIVAVVAKKHQADAIFSFDKFYKSKGFKLISDL